MRSAVLVATLLASAAFSTPAAAMAGYKESLTFVSDLSFGDTARGYSLCLLQKEHVGLWMTYRTEPLRYVFAPDQCEGESFAEIEPSAEGALREAGIIPPLPGKETHLIPAIVLAGIVGLGGLIMLARFFRRG